MKEPRSKVRYSTPCMHTLLTSPLPRIDWNSTITVDPGVELPEIAKSEDDTPAPDRPKPRPRKRPRVYDDGDSDGENVAPPRTFRRTGTGSRATMQAPSVVTEARPRRAVQKKTQPLFLGSDEDEEISGRGDEGDNDAYEEEGTEAFRAAMDAVSEQDEDEDRESSTLRSRSSRGRGSQPTIGGGAARKSATPAPNTDKPELRRTTKKLPVVLDDDSDDGVAFKGFTGRRARK
jgi:hypothetical protein